MDTKILTLKTAGFIALLFISSVANSQDSLLNILDDSLTSGEVTFPVKATFKAIHLVNAHTIKSPAKGDLNFIIMHRFGQINEGTYSLFGLDNAFIRLGLDYGISDRFGIGIGRSSLEKTYDGYLKYLLLAQTEGQKKIPVSISILGSITNYTLRVPDKPFLNAKYRTSYVTQLMVARKFSSSLSLQLSPTWIHLNMVPTRRDNNEVFAAMIGGRMKFNKRMSLTAEYNYLPDGQLESMDLTNSLSLGLDIETGGHVFQLVFSNSRGMTEPQYITRTTGKWEKGDIFFGFNISRVFSLGKEARQRKKGEKKNGEW